MRLLVLTSRFPFPLEKGDKLRIFYQIRELAKHHKIILCALSDQSVSEEEKNELKPFCDAIYIFPLTKSGIAWSLGKSLLNGFPAQVAYFFRKKLQTKIEAVIEQEKPDHIFCQLIRMAEYVRSSEIPTTLDYMDAFSAGMARRAEKSPFYLRPFFRRESRITSKYEASVFADFTYSSIISQQDRTHIKVKNPEKISILPNGIDLVHFQPKSGTVAAFDVVFVGNMGYFPNAVAAKYLIQEVLPEASVPLSISLAGARPPASIKALAGPKIEVTGWVDDIRDAYANGKIFVAPLFTGSGQQNKILEAMAMGIPCITTPMVNNAIGAIAEESILLADSPTTFAWEIEKLLADEVLRKKIGDAGRKFVSARYSWEQSVGVLEGIFGEDGHG